MTYTLGIDPGLSGALCFYHPERITRIYDMPILVHPTSTKKVRKEVNCFALMTMFAQHKVDDCWLEQVHGRPGQGGSAMFNFGEAYGALKACLLASRIQYQLVSPQRWKKSFDLIGHPKSASRPKATELMPHLDELWPMKRHTDRAEAAMIALYGYNQKRKVG
jgi:crossover junction endodeoxyribonuclease RuvC